MQTRRRLAIGLLAAVTVAGVAVLSGRLGGRSAAKDVENSGGEPAAGETSAPAVPTAPGTLEEAERSRLIDRAASISTMTSFLVWHRGERAIAEYYGRMDPGETANIKSAAKSVLGLLVGIAIDEGHIEGVDQTIAPYFQDYFRTNPDSAKERITIRNLLTMRTGLETTSFHNYGEWVASPNWAHYALDQPVVGRRGRGMEYSTGTTHLLSVILTRATGMSTRRYAETRLFEPLGIRLGGWDRDPQGYYMGGNNMALTPEGMLAIGRMILNDGRYEGRQIVPEWWLKESFRAYTRSNYNPYDYGYLWWKRPVARHEVRFAWGYGGQYIFVIPQRRAVVAITSVVRSSDERPDYRRPVFDLLAETIRSLTPDRSERSRPG